MHLHPHMPASPCGRGISWARGRTRALTAVLAMALLSTAWPARGDEAPDDPETVPVFQGGEVVVVGTRAPSEAAPPTASVTQVDLAALPGLQTDLAAPLAEVPSMNVQRTGGAGSPVTAGLRGSAADQVVVRLGELPLTPPGGGSVDLSLLPPALLSSLEVVRGSEAALAGAGALGGAVTLSPLDPGARPGVSVEAGGGSFGTASGAATGRTRLGAATVALGAAGTRSDGSFSFERDLTPSYPDDPWVTQTRAHNASRVGSLVGAASLPAGGGRLALTGFLAGADREIPGAVGNPSPDADSGTWQGLAGAAWSRPGRVRPGLRAWVGGDGGTYDPGATGTGLPAWHRRRTGGAEAKVGLLAGVHLLDVSVRGDVEGFETQDVSVRRASAALVASDGVWLWEDRLALHGALRLALFEGAGLLAMPRAGVRLELTPSLWVATNLGRGARLPTLFELFGADALTRPNPGLRPERATTADLALGWASDRLVASLTGYVSRYRDLISYELYPPFRIMPRNVRDARVLGLELEARGRATAWLELTLAYGFTDARVLGDAPNDGGNRLPYRPPHRGLLRADGTFGRVRTWATVEGQSAQPRNRANTKQVPGRVLVGGGAEVRLASGLWASLTLTNLLDDRRLEDFHGYPLPGRSILGSVRLTLPGDT